MAGAAHGPSGSVCASSGVLTPSDLSLLFIIMSVFSRLSLVLVVISSSVFATPVAAQTSGLSPQRSERPWGGKYVSYDDEKGSAEIVIYSGQVVYARWDRVAGCNLDSKRSDCSLVDQSIRLLPPCSLVWTVPSEDGSINTPDRRVVLKHEFCEVEGE